MISHVRESVDRESIIVVQYLDDIVLVGHHHPTLSTVTERTNRAPECQGYIISPKSELELTQSIHWTGKNVDLSSPCMAPTTPFVANVVAKWLKLVARPYYHKNLHRLLGKVIWLGRPDVLVGSSLAGPQVWLNRGPFSPPPPPLQLFGHCWRL